MSELSSSELKSSKISPPKSLMNIEDSEKVWEVINKKYPKVAPLLGEMEYVLEQAENLLEQLQSPENLGIAFSMDESCNVNLDDDSGGTASEITEDCKTSSNFELENFHCQNSSESIVVAEKSDKEICISKDEKINEKLCCSSITKIESNSLNYNLQIKDDTTELSKHLESNDNLTKYSCKSKNKENDSIDFSENREAHENLKINVKENVLTINEDSRDPKNQIQESIPHFKQVIKTMIKNEETVMSKEDENFRNNLESNEKLLEVVEILRKKDSETGSIDGWDNVVGNVSKTNSPFPLEDC